ncbi:universal stress protein [Halosolutus amylolyticus]|uniref:Universal stress protein n=1 Tax=Halosolutus amylolyticus TaxID=2932267 RepID=A0ABD5PLK1_9EURY|nr:universal stress protein [Halosolutus amylolyticus]
MPPIDDAIESVLLPTDGSDGALAGAKRGLDLAVAAGADVHVLSVVDTSEVEGVSGIFEDDTDEARAAIEAEAETAVETVARAAEKRDPDLEVTTTVERGKPFRIIESTVDAAGIDVVAMGTRGRAGLERVVLGSVTENVLRTAPVPVLAVPPEAGDVELTTETTENVLLPTDGSEGAEVAVDWGVTLADAFDAMLHTIYSADTSRFTGSAEPGTILTKLEREGEDALGTVRDRARAAGVSVTGTVATGPPARAVLNYADEHAIDLLAIGTHGRSGLERKLLGSVTENVVRNADVPVLCVPMSHD